MKVAIADDHRLVRHGIVDILKSQGVLVEFQAANGKELVDYASVHHPDIVLMDLNMPVMDGWEATAELRVCSPNTRVIALSVLDDDFSVIRMLRCGARGYLLKDSEPEDLVNAIQSVYDTGFFHSDFVSSRLMKAMPGNEEAEDVLALEGFNGRELEFLQLACTEFTYKEISEKMCASPRTVDGYRDSLFKKLKIKSRVGLVIYAIKNHLVEV